MKHKVLEKIKGSDLVEKRYVPLFDYFKPMGEGDGQAFKIIGGSFVTKDAGTGIVHCAPGFGEDDYAACIQAKII
jgi:isoleucyl-tRNA synthetase